MPFRFWRIDDLAFSFPSVSLPLSSLLFITMPMNPIFDDLKVKRICHSVLHGYTSLVLKLETQNLPVGVVGVVSGFASPLSSRARVRFLIGKRLFFLK
jgi:hypothetical protein